MHRLSRRVAAMPKGALPAAALSENTLVLSDCVTVTPR